MPALGVCDRRAVRCGYPDHQETIAAGEAYYLPPGHVPDYLEDTEVFEVSPHRLSLAARRLADRSRSVMAMASSL